MSLTEETLNEVNKLLAGNAAKAGIATSTGLVAYNLEEFAKLMVPEFKLIRDETPREAPKGNVAGLQPHWKQITSFNSADVKLYTPEGARGGTISYTEADKTAPYVTLGLENNATFEAESAGEGFDNIDDLATLGLMYEMFAQEERVIIGGNYGQALGQTGTPTLTLEASGGSLTNGATYYVGCVALTYDGWDFANKLNVVKQAVTQTQAGAAGGITTFNGGSAKISSTANVLTTGSNQSIVATVAALSGAVAYAWFVSAGGSAGTHQYFAGVTTQNSINITAEPSATGQDFQTLTAGTDYSQNTYAFDGLISQTQQAGYVYTMATGTVGVGGAGTGLTPAPTGAGVGIVEFETVLYYLFQTYNTGIDQIWVSAQEMKNISNKVLSAGSAPLIRFNYTPNEIESGKVIGGAVVGFYLNAYAVNGPSMIPIRLHPYMVPGTVLFQPKKLPYAVSNVGTILRMNTRKEYYQLQWPLTKRQREWGVYVEEVLQNYAPFAFAIITNIANK
jgi:hypothetical protein